MACESLDRRFLIGALGGAAGLAAAARLAKAGPLDPPPGPVAPTGTTLRELADRIARTSAGVAEPRIPVQSLPGSATALHVLSEPGSYYLTGNIVGEAGRNGIEIDADNVSLDLAGSSIQGVAGSLDGVRVRTFGRRNIAIFGGGISDWPGFGVAANESVSSIIRDLLVTRCGPGIEARDSSLIYNCSLINNAGTGIQINGQPGLVIGCVIRECANGVWCKNRAQILDCSVFAAGEGFVLNNGGLIRGCSAADCAVGIVANHGFVLDSMAFSCSVGLRAVEWSRIERVAAIGGTTGFEAIGQNNLLIACSAQGSASPFAIGFGNSHGPVINVAGVGDISGVPGAEHPWANFTY